MDDLVFFFTFEFNFYQICLKYFKLTLRTRTISHRFSSCQKKDRNMRHLVEVFLKNVGKKFKKKSFGQALSKLLNAKKGENSIVL